METPTKPKKQLSDLTFDQIAKVRGDLTIIWYAPITSNDVFVQANGRITRPGQKHGQLIVMLEGTEVERRYYRRLQNKQRVQGTLLDLVQEARK